MRNPLLKVLPAVALTAGVLAPAAIMTMPTEAEAHYYHCGNEFQFDHEHARFHRYEACGKRRDGGSDIPDDPNYTGPHSPSSGSSSSGGSSSSSGSSTHGHHGGSSSKDNESKKTHTGGVFSSYCKAKTSRGYTDWQHEDCKKLANPDIRSLSVAGGNGLRVGKCNTVVAVLTNRNKEYQGNETFPVKLSLGSDGHMDTWNIIAEKQVRMPAGGRSTRVQFDNVHIKEKGKERLWASAFGPDPEIGLIGSSKSTPKISIDENCPSKCNIQGSASQIGKTDIGRNEAVETKIKLSNKDGANCPAQTVYLQRKAENSSKWTSVASKRFGANNRGTQYGTLKDTKHPSMGTYSYRVHFSVPRKQVNIGTVNFYIKEKGDGEVNDANAKGSNVQKDQVQQRGMAKPKPKTVKQQAVSGKKVEQKNKPASSQQQYQGSPQYQQPKTVQPQRNSPYSR